MPNLVGAGIRLSCRPRFLRVSNFDFTTNSSPVDIEALAARYQDEDFWRRSMTKGDDDGPQE